MPCSFLARHELYNSFEVVMYNFHALLVPVVIISSCIQVLSGFYQARFFHRSLGTLVKVLVFPSLIFSGWILTVYTMMRNKTHLVPISSVFISYGLSYTLFGFELFRYMGSNEAIHGVIAGVWLSCLYRLFMLDTVMSYELYVMLTPIPILHILSGLCTSMNKHHVKGLIYSYLGLMGTAFTVSYDTYWIFQKLPPVNHRMLIQSIPLLVHISMFMVLPIKKIESGQGLGNSGEP